MHDMYQLFRIYSTSERKQMLLAPWSFGKNNINGGLEMMHIDLYVYESSPMELVGVHLTRLLTKT